MESSRSFSEAQPRPPAQGDASEVCRPPAGAFCRIRHELRAHMPFTFFGTLTGVGILAAFVVGEVPPAISTQLFWALHPLHVLLSAVTTTAMFTLHSRRTLLATLLIGYLGSVGIATLSDCLILAKR